jgi:hypothetical protein
MIKVKPVKASGTDVVAGQFQAGGLVDNRVGAGGVYTVDCYDAQGNLKWSEEMHNLVVNVGLKDMNDKYFTGSAYTAAWYLGLVTGPGASNTYAAGDTMASHAGWTEDSGYSQATRPAATLGAATTADPSVITNALSVAVFSINATTTIAGAFLTSDDTKGGTTGVLFSVANFQAPGDRAVVSGDTLNVTYTFSLDAV